MTAVDYAGIEIKKNELVRKGLQGSVFVAESTADPINVGNLFDVDSGGLVELPAGYIDLGWTATTGAVFARKVTSTDISAWGTNDPVRSDITADATTLQVDAYETKLATIALYAGVDRSSIVPQSNGAIEVDLPTSPYSQFYRVLAVAVDDSDGGEIVLARFMPRCQVTDYTSQSYSNDKDPIVWGVEFTAYEDSTLGFAQSQLYGGEGWQSLLVDMGFPLSVVGSTTATSADVTLTTGTASAEDEGASITGDGIPSDTTILTVTDSTHIILSAEASATATGVALTING